MARKPHKWHYIYKTTCNVTGRYYIGMHSTSNLEDGYMGSGKRLRRSLDKYGIENHTKEILEFLNNRESLAKRESEIVNEQSIDDPLCMNLKPGGFGGLGSKIPEESLLSIRQGASKFLSEKWKDPEYRLNMNKILSKNIKDQHRLGKRESIQYDWKGKKHKEETKYKMSIKAKERINDKNSQFGTCWITDGTQNMKIKKSDLIPEGWNLGRKMKK
jgi:hypothetical protein